MMSQLAWGRLAGLVALGMLAAYVAPSTARASCLPDGEPLWTYPADGDLGVPLDADLMIIGEARKYTARLDGELLEPSGGGGPWFVFDMGRLAPESTHEVTLRTTGPGGKKVEWTMRFESGDAETETSDAAPVLTDVDVERDFRDDFPCDAGTYEGLCEDAFPIDLVRFSVKPPEGTKLWIIRSSYAEDGIPEATPFPAERGEPPRTPTRPRERRRQAASRRLVVLTRCRGWSSRASSHGGGLTFGE